MLVRDWRRPESRRRRGANGALGGGPGVPTLSVCQSAPGRRGGHPKHWIIGCEYRGNIASVLRFCAKDAIRGSKWRDETCSPQRLTRLPVTSKRLLQLEQLGICHWPIVYFATTTRSMAAWVHAQPPCPTYTKRPSACIISVYHRSWDDTRRNRNRALGTNRQLDNPGYCFHGCVLGSNVGGGLAPSVDPPQMNAVSAL